MTVRDFHSLLAMLRSAVEQMDYDDCEKVARRLDTNLDNALWWVDTDDEAIDLADTAADACYDLAKPFARGVLSPGQITAGKQRVYDALDRLQIHLNGLPPSVEAVKLAQLEAELFPGRVAKLPGSQTASHVAKVMRDS